MLAKQENVTQRYIPRLIKMAFLSPDIMEAIIKDNTPKKLTIGLLRDRFSYDWDEQGKELGFDY